MFFPYVELNFFSFVFILIVFILMLFKSRALFKKEKFFSDYKSCEKELNSFKIGVENFVKTKKSQKVLMSAFALEFAIKNNAFGDKYTKQFKQILNENPNEKEFNIEIDHYLSQKA
ncbi:hypothetical protein C414_000260158 [Campylobacter jejuni subsp. jejuni 414]|nr:hypothetical protein C414_000260158 [Campylobacter jejuni subsp. jejuni 414]